jgi:hypothetical protein
MVSCQEPSPLKGRKHSQQCHPHDAALVNALSFVSMGVEARCCPCHSTAYCRHMKRQPCLCHHHPCHGLCHCNCPRHLNRHCRLHHHRHFCCPSPLPLAIAVVVAVDHRRRPLCFVTISHGHRRRHRPCHRPLPSPSPLSLQLPSLLAITVTIAVSHFQELLPWHGKNCIRPIEAKNAHLIFFCLDSGRHAAQSRMTDQVSGGNGQHQRWAASGKQ